MMVLLWVQSNTKHVFMAVLLLFCLTTCVEHGDLVISDLVSTSNNSEELSLPLPPAPKPLFLALSSGGNHNLVINPAGELYAWGRNHYRQLGDGTTTAQNSPVKISSIGTASNWVKIAAGYAHCLAINADGELYVWGRNGSGQLGDGTTSRRSSPIKIGTGASTETNWVSVAVGYEHSLAINAAGELYAWGSSHHGQVGDGKNLNQARPVKITVPGIGSP